MTRAELLRLDAVGFSYSITTRNNDVGQFIVFLPRFWPVHADQGSDVIVWYLRYAQRALITRIVFADINALEELRGPLVEFRIVEVFKIGHFIAQVLFEFSRCPTAQATAIIDPVRVIIVIDNNVIMVRASDIIIRQPSISRKMFLQIFDVRIFARFELIKLFTVNHPTRDCSVSFPLSQTNIGNRHASEFIKL